MVISVYGMVIAMVWYEWYGMIWLYHSVVCDMVWYLLWYGMKGRVWYYIAMVWYDSTSGMV